MAQLALMEPRAQLVLMVPKADRVSRAQLVLMANKVLVV
jgi:hypothetical protein